MPTQEARALILSLDTIARDAQEYFRRPELAALEKPQYAHYLEGADHFWRELPDFVQGRALELVSALIDLGNDSAAAVRRSPLLGEADLNAIGHAIKGMRATLRLRTYDHWDPEVLHDEGMVLGVKPGAYDESAAHPEEAETAFMQNAAKMAAVLELAGAGIDQGRVAITGTGLSAPAGYRPSTAFIMMPMQSERPELDDVCDTVKRCFAKFAVGAVRADDIEHEDVITKKILDQIRTAEFLFADLTGERPSVYYEVGYAHALGRRVMLFRRSGTDIHFDLAGYNCPEYENLRSLEHLLTRRLESVTGQTPSDTAEQM